MFMFLLVFLQSAKRDERNPKRQEEREEKLTVEGSEERKRVDGRVEKTREERNAEECSAYRYRENASSKTG